MSTAKRATFKAVLPDVDSLIVELRGQKVLLDADLGRIYGVQTRVLNQAVKRNPDRFAADFLIDLSREEILRISQSVTSLRRLKFSKQVRAFTEHGAIMAATVLNSPRANSDERVCCARFRENARCPPG